MVFRPAQADEAVAIVALASGEWSDEDFERWVMLQGGRSAISPSGSAIVAVWLRGRATAVSMHREPAAV